MVRSTIAQLILPACWILNSYSTNLIAPLSDLASFYEVWEDAATATSVIHQHIQIISGITSMQKHLPQQERFVRARSKTSFWVINLSRSSMSSQCWITEVAKAYTLRYQSTISNDSFSMPLIISFAVSAG